uniref:Uncharacterized protein n=1 Tax=Coccidioides posadasii RMSCC 3488 TaxID=454284 RepID=A0A0J6FAI1_COCPO|nr:hypothetical protein CPAG_06358 [Coccidioides posadasii RMSCC 3488]
MAQRIDDAMVDVINKMNDITEHLRAHEFVESANRIARNVHEVINIFTNAVIKFNDDQMIMHQVAPRAEPSAPKQVANKNGQSLMLYSDVARQAPGAMSGSSSAQATSSGTVKAVINPVVPVGHPPILDVAEEKAAMLTISEISSRGSFLGQERSKRARTGSGLFGGSYKIVSAAEFAWDKEIRKMEAKPRERRRLTFARGGLLGGNLTVKKILNDMGQLVGAEAIEFVWAFNTGNVTAVFKSVATARTVRDHFLDLAIHKSNPYYDVQVTFSTDPCEKQLNLESQIGVPQHRRNRGRRAGA